MEEIRKTCVIAMGSQKGGVGKTTHTVHIARALVERGRKVLIIDLDMNQGATRHFGVELEAHLGSYEMLVGDERASNLVLDHDDYVSLPVNLSLIAAARKLEGVDQALAQKRKLIMPREVLREPLESLRGLYDYIFLDTATNATTLTIASYLAADYFILSATPDPFAIAGLNDALTNINNAQQQGNPNLVLLGVVLSGVDKRTSQANSLTEFLEKAFEDDVDAEPMKFRTTIGRSTAILQTQKVGKTLFETHSSHKVTEEYRMLAAEIEERLARIEQRPTLEIGYVANG